MSYEETLSRVRFISENAVNHPLRCRSIAPYQPKRLQPVAQPPAPPAARPPAVNGTSARHIAIQDYNGAFKHRISGSPAISRGRDPLNRIILENAKGRRFHYSEADLLLWWQPVN